MASELQTIFGQRVAERRRALGLTQAALAKKLGMKQPALCDIEKGRHAPTLETVESVALALEIPPAALVG